MALPNVNDDDVFELTNIKVEEVSLVDRAANQRKFVVVKRADKKGTGAPITAEDAAKALLKAQENGAGTPAAELDARDAAAKNASTETAVVPAETVAAPVIEPAPTAPASKSEVDIVVTESGGTVDISVSATPSFAEGSAKALLMTKLRMAWLGAIDAIRLRLDALTQSVNSPSDGVYITWEAYNHVDYIRCMLESFYSIGGPEWDIAVAAVAAAAMAKSDTVKKQTEDLKNIGTAISASNVRKTFDVQAALKALLGPAPIVEALKTEEKPAVKTESIASTEPVVVAPVVAIAPVAPAIPTGIAPIDITQDPAFKAMQEALKTQEQAVALLKANMTAQEKDLAKARSTIRSNALTDDSQTSHNEVVWDRDMASPTAQVRRTIR